MNIPIAIVWHQHQPFYKDLRSGLMAMPWVRLHGIKDYYGMARMLEQYPGVRCTINLVPSLIMQLRDYVEHGAKDDLLVHTEKPAADLNQKEAEFVLDQFFSANHDFMIRVHPRFGELLDLRRLGRRSAESALSDFGVQDLRDLQIWFNLAWFHPVCLAEFEPLRALREKGRGFTEADKAEMLRVQDEVLARVIPLHKKLSQQGQLELTTTPFYHPILPLLCDMQSALVAMPNTPMPEGYAQVWEDAHWHVEKAVRYHKEVFGEAPVGMWPAEGSVSPAILPLLAQHGIQWMATDEGILGASLRTGLRGPFGKLERADLLYRPWLVESNGVQVKAIFRDHDLSDRVGFHYQSWEGGAAAQDFLGRIRENAKGRPAGDETIVPVILDGENCWEHFHDQGMGFLHNLYRRLQDGQDGLVSTRVRDFLADHPPSHRVEHLFSGSWINHDFYIWIGHEEDRKAWEYVFRVRKDLVVETEKRKSSREDDDRLKQAWEELYIAEGSDWYWWYGDDRSSGNDEAFDLLFRTHLKNVYYFLDVECPYFLDHPVILPRTRVPYTKPHGVLSVALDGQVTSYFEWASAGRYRSDRDGGVMAASSPPLVQQIFFGYDRDHLCLRVDMKGIRGQEAPGASEGLPVVKEVTLLFVEPKGVSLKIKGDGSPRISTLGPWAGKLQEPLVVWDQILEGRIPFQAFGIPRGKELAFYVQVEKEDGTCERFPRTYALSFSVPSEDIEAQDWFI